MAPSENPGGTTYRAIVMGCLLTGVSKAVMTRPRSKIALIYFAVLLFAAVLATAQKAAVGDIVARLLPDGDPHRLVILDPAQKSSAIKELQSAQKAAHDARLVEVAFLLAAYDSNYDKNRDYLIANLRGCTSPGIKSGCNGNIADYLIVLYEHGHKDVLKPLMLVGKDSFSPVVADKLGGFFSNLVADGPADFFDTIRPFPPQTQTQLCDLAGISDGGGMSAAQLQQVRQELKARGDDLSLACLETIEAANRH
jgi:hypothetical protein